MASQVEARQKPYSASSRGLSLSTFQGADGHIFTSFQAVLSLLFSDRVSVLATCQISMSLLIKHGTSSYFSGRSRLQSCRGYTDLQDARMAECDSDHYRDYLVSTDTLTAYKIALVVTASTCIIASCAVPYRSGFIAPTRASEPLSVKQVVLYTKLLADDLASSGVHHSSWIDVAGLWNITTTMVD